MGAVIESARVLPGRGGPFATTAMKLTDAVARQALQEAGIGPSDLEILVNAGIYHDRHIGEPAVAALIQGDLGANAGHPVAGTHGTFSFDLLNGASGVLSAVHIVDGLTRSGAVRHGLVVAADVDPDPSSSRGVRFTPAAGAVVLGAGPEGSGFLDFAFEDFPEHEDLYVSAVSWREPAGPHLPGRSGKNRLEIVELPGYLERSVDCAAHTARGFLDRNELGAGDIDVLVAAHTSPGFADLLAEAVGIPRAAVSHVTEAFERAHTAQVIAAWSQARAARRLQPSGMVLLVTAGAGISVGAALYRCP